MFAPSISRRVCPDAQCSAARHALFLTSDLRPLPSAERGRLGGFTLFELLIVVCIIGLLMVLIAPAFTTIKSGSDFSTAVNGIRDVLENARTYAKANHTYVFVGLAEVDSSVESGVSPQVTTGATPYGRVAVAVVASKDGTRHFNYATSVQGNDWQTNYSNGANLTAVGKITEV
jgi:type II secretory pathway pseudopilin PulG